MKKKSTIFSVAFQKTAAVLFTGTLLSATLFAQKGTDYQTRLSKDLRVEKATMNNDLQTPSLIRLSSTSKVTLAETPATLMQMVGADANTEFRKVEGPNGSSSFKNSAAAPVEGIHTEKFQQYFKGIKVQHGTFNALMRGDKTEFYNGEYYDIKSVKTNPTISEAKALEFAKAFVGANKYAWEQAKEARDLETNQLRKQLYNDAYEKLLPKGELVIIRDHATKNVTDLSYKFDIYAGEPMSRAWIYVNAHTGKIMLNDRIIKHLSPDQKNNKEYNGAVPEIAFIMSGNADAAAPLAAIKDSAVAIPTRYAGTRIMGVTQFPGTDNDPSGSGAVLVNSTSPIGAPFLPGQNPWVLMDKRFHGVGSNQSEQTYDLNGVGGAPVSTPTYGTARSFTDLDNNWTLAEHNRSVNNEEQNNDDYAFDAHWGAGIVYQYWKDIHGRFSYDNQNASIKSYVHSGIAYDNAFWNGSVMTYGDGSFQGGKQAGFAPLTSLDVCGHEVGHAVCTFTSDLVYEKESGGLNEGYSDVWAACTENFALTRFDASLIASATRPNGFDIWGIGEQIDANDATGTMPNLINRPTIDPLSTALRYMDKPGKAGDPSSYAENTNDFNGAAERWTEQDGCTPNFAVNDGCGVHSTSGVLNRAFYYLVTGSPAKTVNTRKAITDAAAGGAQFAAQPGEPYKVTGIGFAKAEKIFYLAEQNLNSNSTFHQARNVMVAAAEVLYGKCSFEWKQTIVAFHGVAIGRSSDTLLCATLPTFSASISRTSVNESIAKSNVNCTDPVTNVIVSFSVITPGFLNPLSITVTPSGTATNGQDYILESTTASFPAVTTGLRSINLGIYNDAEREGLTPEIISLAIRATDGAGFIKDTILNVSITDDDLTPIVSNNRAVLLTENFNATTGSAIPTNWTMVDRLGASTVKWLTSATGATQYGFTSRTAFVALITPMNLGDATATPQYDPAAAGEVVLVTPTISALGKSDLKLKFRYAAGGEPSGDGLNTFDFGRIVYSLDNGVTFLNFSDSSDRKYALRPTATLDSIILPTFLNGRTFKLGFNWSHDANLAAPPPFIIDDVEVTGGGQRIETQLNQGVSEKQFANKDLFYSSANDGQLLVNIKNNSVDLGCVLVKVTEAGLGKATQQAIVNGFRYDRANRVVTITPSQNASSATYDLTLYVTTAELTGLPASSLQIIKVKDGVPTTGTIAPGDAQVLTPAFGDSSANGYYTYTLTGVTGFSQFVLGLNTNVLAIKLQSFTAAAKNNKFVNVAWSASGEETNGNYTVERAEKGSNNYTAITTQKMRGGNSVNSYSFNDYSLASNITYQYRLRSEVNGVSNFSDLKFATLTGKLNNVEIAPNPSQGIFTIAVRGFNGESNINVFNEAGQKLVQRKQIVVANAPFTIDLTAQPTGTYTMNMVINGKTETFKLIVN